MHKLNLTRIILFLYHVFI